MGMGSGGMDGGTAQCVLGTWVLEARGFSRAEVAVRFFGGGEDARDWWVGGQ